MTQEQRNKKAEQLRLAAQIIETGCEWEVWSRISSTWCQIIDKDPTAFVFEGSEIRIKEPVIPVPEGWRELRDDEKDGRWIDGAKWLSIYTWTQIARAKPGCYATINNRIIVPVAKPRVPLEPGDVPPGSVVRAVDGTAAESGGWSLILVATKNGITAISKNGRPELFSWEFAFHNQEIKRPTDTEWQPASKEAP